MGCRRLNIYRHEQTSTCEVSGGDGLGGGDHLVVGEPQRLQHT